jgi:serine kinase of HPr protein (carbohydrate metabolism regulator)
MEVKVDTKELVEKIGLKPLSTYEAREIKGVFVSDMISDVMTGAKSGNLWLTIQTHKSIVPTANLADISAIIITNNKKVPDETVELASKYSIALLSANMTTFELAIKLHEIGLK